MKIYYYVLILAVCLVLWFGFNKQITGFIVYESPSQYASLTPQENGTIVLYFCPGKICQDAFTNAFTKAQQSIHCAFFEINDESIINTLAEKSAVLDVKIVVDSDNIDENLFGEGVVVDDKKQYMHNKFCVIDHELIVTGSANPTKNDLFKNNNNILVLESSYLAQNYEAEFQELWYGEFGSGKQVMHPEIRLNYLLNNITIKNYFCPDDGCEEKVASLLDGAKKTIYFMTFSFTSDILEQKLIEKAQQGVIVKGVFEKRQNSEYSAMHGLQKANLSAISVVYDKNPYTMHHKVFIIDHEIVVIGSYNPTNRGTKVNDENVIVVYDLKIAQDFLDEFEKVYKEN